MDIIIIIKNECHSNIIVDRLQGWWKDTFIRFDMIHERDRQTPHDDIGPAYALHGAAKMKATKLMNRK